jgi:hypothetical protein
MNKNKLTPLTFEEVQGEASKYTSFSVNAKKIYRNPMQKQVNYTLIEKLMKSIINKFQK